ncbi:nose resistant to fluoxetine protein 6, partial [Caerostris darwini]
KIQDTVDIVHMKTFTHAGPYFVGIILGFLMIKYKDIRMPWFVNSCGWFASTLLCLTSVYGAHRWNIGDPHGPLLTAIFAAVHRTTFAMGVGWITFACVTGHGGAVNKFLSWSLLAPVSRLTFMIYLLHSLVIWVRMGSLRERLYFSHYNMVSTIAKQP